MKHGTHPSPRQRLFASVATYALALLLGASTQSASAYDNQYGTSFTSQEEQWNTPHLIYLSIWDAGSQTSCAHKFAVVDPNSPWNTFDYGGVENYYDLPGGNGTIEFDVQLGYDWCCWQQIVTPSIQLIVDSSLSTSSSVTHSWDSENSRTYHVIYNPSDSVIMKGGAKQFALRLYYPGVGGPICDMRFKALMIGTTYTNVMGHFNAPQLPLYILRDPPGDLSSSSLTTAHGACTGTSTSVTTGNTEDGFFKARLGVAGDVPLIGLAYEIFVEFGVSVAASQSMNSSGEYTNCFSSSSSYSTPTSGPPDDVFIGSAIQYVYGFAIVVSRPACDSVSVRYDFVSQPVGSQGSYTYSESHIRDFVIPAMIADIATMPPGAERAGAETQLSVWYQTLAMNDSIKANAPYDHVELFSGGGGAVDHTLESTTTEAYAINYDAQLDNGFSLEFGVNIGGSGVSGGGSVHMQQGYGRGQSGTNEHTNTVAYALGDQNASDDFAVKVYRDPVFGSYVFELDSAASRTSCDYEGGFQIDQPQLWIGSMGSTNAQLNEVPIGGNAIFPIYVCNNSDIARTYLLTADYDSNNLGAVISGYNGITNGATVSLTVPANGCRPVANIYLAQPDNSIVDFDGLLLFLSSACGDIVASGTLSAHFGVGNFGSYCQPSSTEGTALGDYVDGVVLGNISNTGTGSVTGAVYTDYSAQFSTPLSRNAQQVVSITAGANLGDHFAVWIDYDGDRAFEASEKLGEFENSAAGESHDFAFTVPVSAQLGSTIMRVRGVAFGTSEPTPVDPCYSYQAGETEDYTVVIDANTPQDCAGVNNGTALPGTACSDGNANTGNDTWTANCVCVGQVLDCAGVPGGTTTIGSPCDDGNTNTAGDAYDGNCLCTGLTYDCLGVPGGTAVNGAACDDGDAGTGNDVYDGNCLCAGQLIDCVGVPGGTTSIGTPCDDGNPLSGGDAYAANCACVGAFATDCTGVLDGSSQPGTACDDSNAATGDDTYGVNCVCAGVAYDCAGIVGGAQLPGTPCDDGNSASTNDVFTVACVCEGVFANDCVGVPGGTALPGTACDDGNADTGNDVYNAFCDCAGELTDCNGVIGGPAQPGSGCDDGNAATGGDVIDTNCQCAGLLFDCLGLPGGTSTIGSACDDANASTSNDVYTANCICAGTLPSDCEGVAGGTAQPGTTCDDGDATTGNDVYSTNCVCAGELIDCEGTVGGAVLPGTACDDGVACTANDVRGTDCTCSGTTITIGAVTGSTMVFGNTTNVYLVTPVANATSYNWALPNGWTTGDNGAFALVAEVNNTPGDVELCVTATVGDCELTSCITVTVDFNTGIATSAATSSDWFTVQPNPNNGVFQLIPGGDDAPMTITVYDGTGRIVKAQFPVVGKRTVSLDLGDVAPGAYYLMATREGQQRAVKLVIER